MRERVINAVGWVAFGEVGLASMRMLSSLVVAALVSPSVFGLMAVASAFIAGLEMFSEVGIKAALIQNARGDDERFQNTAWTMQVIRGCVIFVITIGLAVPAARFYETPEMQLILPATGFTSLLSSLVASRYHMATRHLMQRRVSLLEILGSLGGMVVRIGVALAWPTVWSLIFGAWAQHLVVTILSYYVIPGIRNRFCLDSESRIELLRFGRWILISTVLVFLGGQMDRLIFAKLIPLALLGSYYLASNIISLPTVALSKVVGLVGFPALSRIRERDGCIVPALRQLRLPILFCSGASFSLLVLFGPLIISWIFDERYKAVGWLIQLLGVAGWFGMAESLNGCALMVLGLPKLNAIANVVKVISMAVLIPLGSYLGGDRYGFAGAFLGLTVSSILRYIVSTIQAKAQGVSGWGLELGGSLATAGCVAAAVLFEGVPGVVSGVVQRIAYMLIVFVVAWSPLAVMTWREVRFLLPGKTPSTAV